MSCLVDFKRNLHSPAGLHYLPPIVCFRIDLQFPFFAPLTSKKNPVCYWLQFCSHLFFPHFCSALLKLAAFYATVLHVAPFLAHPTHRHQTGNCIVSHDLTLHVSTVDVSSKYIAGYSTDGERGRTGNQVPLMMTDCQPHIWNTRNYLDFFPNSRIKAFCLKPPSQTAGGVDGS